MAEAIKKSFYPELPTEDASKNAVNVGIEAITSNNNGNPDPDNNTNGHATSIQISHSTTPENDPIYPSLEDLEPSPIRQHYNTFLAEYIFKIEEIIEKLKEIKIKAENHHYKSNCVKLSSTVVGTTGVALVMGSLASAPFTAGSSILFGAGGAVMSVTGSLANVITDYVDYKTTATIMDDIKLLAKEKDMFDAWMQKSLSHFNECIDQLTAKGISRDVAITTIIEGIAKGAINILEKPNETVMKTLTTAVKLQHVENIVVSTLPVIGKTFHMTEKSFQFIYNILGLTGRTVPTVMKEFAKISGMLSMAFVVADISLLIKDLCSDHPSIEVIDKGIKQLEDEKNILEDLLDVIKAAGASEEIVLERALKDIGMIEDEETLLRDFVIINEEEFHERAGITV